MNTCESKDDNRTVNEELKQENEIDLRIDRENICHPQLPTEKEGTRSQNCITGLENSQITFPCAHSHTLVISLPLFKMQRTDWPELMLSFLLFAQGRFLNTKRLLHTLIMDI